MTHKTSFKDKELGQIFLPREDLEQIKMDNPLVISNAKAITNHSIFGVNHLVDLKIVVEGTVLKNFKDFQLNQSIKGHHTFVLSLNNDALGEIETYQMMHTQELLGKRILVRFNFKHTKKKPERDFIGIITEVSFEQAQGNQGYSIIKGYSPTILLDKAPHIQSFGGSNSISLPTIVDQLLEEGYTQKGKYHYAIQSSKNNYLPYSCQYNESAYNYLARMAEAYGEQFFYDGETLYFGDIPFIEDPIPLIYGRDIDQVKVSLSAQHINRELYGYSSLTNEKLSAIGDTKLQIKGTLAKTAYEKSQRIFTAPSLQAAPIKASTNQDVTQAQQGLIGSVGTNVFVISGTTTVPFLYPGCIIKLSMLQPYHKESHYFTKLMITSINHMVDVLGKYKGYFEAVDAETGFIPRIAYKNPLTEQQIATVVSNTDPQNKGRVQVRFDWQNAEINTAFIRVMAPDAGSSDTVDTNRGFVAIPEVGDQVMVGFLNQHPDRPFVMGGLFHGTSSSGGGKDNNSKSWSSKSGHRIEFNDAGGIKIIDKKKNIMELDGEGNVNIKSAKSIVLQAGRSSLILEEQGKITIEGLELSMKGEAITTVATTKLIEQSGEANLTLTSEDSNASLTSKTTTISGKNEVIVSGGLDAKLVAGGTAAIQGAIVKLN